MGPVYYLRIYRWSGSALQQLGSTLMGVSSYDGFGARFRETVALLWLVLTDTGNYCGCFPK